MESGVPSPLPLKSRAAEQKTSGQSHCSLKHPRSRWLLTKQQNLHYKFHTDYNYNLDQSASIQPKTSTHWFRVCLPTIPDHLVWRISILSNPLQQQMILLWHVKLSSPSYQWSGIFGKAQEIFNPFAGKSAIVYFSLWNDSTGNSPSLNVTSVYVLLKIALRFLSVLPFLKLILHTSSNADSSCCSGSIVILPNSLLS